ncbi:MAG: DUF58 domain-containing protein [Bryobacteraceae bacterium]
MIYPTKRFLWIVGLCFVPASVLPAIVPSGPVWVGIAALFLAAFAALDWLVSRRSLDSLRLTFPADIHAILGEDVSFPVGISRTASRPWPCRKLRLAVGLPREIDAVRDDVAFDVLPEAQAMEIELCAKGEQRGEFAASTAYLGRISGFGLWQLRRTQPIAVCFSIQPSIAKIARGTSRLMASHAHGSERLIARHGRGREFEHLREYVPNDNFADIDWKATARRRVPIVREYRVERTQDIYVCVDASRLSGSVVTAKDGRTVTLLDEYVRSTILVQCAVRTAGDRFGLLTFSNRVHHFFKAASLPSYEREFRISLFPLRPRAVAPAFDEVCSTLTAQVKRRALIVFFTSLAEPQLAEAFATASRLLARQHLVVVACPSDAKARPLFSNPDVHDFDSLYGELAGHLLWKKMAEMRARVSHFGVRMNVVAPGRLGLSAATEYFDIKERQLL